jgi:Cu(I)/Ag(I) efflux system membrane protein CusA/SilA
MGRSPQVIEDQVTYPLVSNLGNPKNQKHSCFIDVWDEFCLHHFEDNVDPYWARTRVLERLNYAQRLLPASVVPLLVPMERGRSRILVPSGNQWNGFRGTTSFARLVRKICLQTVPGVAEVASLEVSKSNQLVLDPLKNAIL